MIKNIALGERGIDIFKPTSTIGDYVAAGVTALIPGKGMGAAFVRNVVAEGITSIEREIAGAHNDIKESAIRIACGTVIDSSVELGVDKVENIISAKKPANYSTYAGTQYKKYPGITQKEIAKKMVRSHRWYNRFSGGVRWTADAVRSAFIV